MTTADLPDIQLSPMRVGTSQEGTQVLDRVLEIDRGKKDDILDLEKVGVEGRSEGEVSKEKPLEISDREKTTEGSVHTPISSERVSWVGVVQGQKVLRKYDVEVQMQDGIGSVIVPEEVMKDAPLWDDFLIGKFLDIAPHIGKVHAIVNKIWTLNDRTQKVEVFEVNETMMKFRILNNADKNRVLRRGMWNIAGVPVVLTKWSPVIEKEKPPTQSIPMWVHIKNVPVNMFSWQGLSFVTSPIGSPVRLHPETAQCLNIEEAKIFVKVDLTKDLPKKMKFTIRGKDVIVEYTYPRLPTKCPRCEKWGHTIKRCPQELAEMEDEKEEGEEGEISDVQNGEKVEETQVQVLQSQSSSPVESKEKIEETPEVEKNEEWLKISPGRASRSPSQQRDLQFGQVSLLTKSRFSVLEDEEEEVSETESERKSMEENKEKEEVRVSRQVLPRDSKMNHRYLRDKGGQKAQDTGGPSYLNKKKPRR